MSILLHTSRECGSSTFFKKTLFRLFFVALFSAIFEQ
jgi:hypothetical protein